MTPPVWSPGRRADGPRSAATDDDDERFRAVTQDAQLLHQLDRKYDGHSKSHVGPVVSPYFLLTASAEQL